MCYMDCDVYLEATGRGWHYKKRWVIRDRAWGNKLVASFTEVEFFAKDNYGDSKVDEYKIIRDWMDKKKNDPEWLAYKSQRDIKDYNREIEKTLIKLED